MSEHQVGMVAGVEAGRRVQFEAIRFLACCVQKHLDAHAAGGNANEPCGEDCHTSRFHEDCPDCVLIEDLGVVADSHPGASPARLGMVGRIKNRLKEA